MVKGGFRFSYNLNLILEIIWNMEVYQKDVLARGQEKYSENE